MLDGMTKFPAAPPPLLPPEHLQDIMQALSSATTRADMFRVVLEPARTVVGAAAVFALLKSYERPGVDLYATGETSDAQTVATLSQQLNEVEPLQPLSLLVNHVLQALPDAGEALHVPPAATLLVALRQGDAQLGVVALRYETARTLNAQQCQFLQFLVLQCVLALGRATAMEDLELKVAQRTQQLQEQADILAVQTRVLEGFAEFAQNLSSLQERTAVIERAQEIMLSLLPDGYSVYYELEDQVWRKRAQVGTLSAPLQALVDAGRPYGVSQATDRVWETGRPIYQDGYDPSTDSAGMLASHIRASVTLPVQMFGAPCGVLRVGLTGEKAGWTKTDRIMLETLVHHLGLVLEGVQRADALRAQTLELLRSNQELERFAYIASHDLQEPLRTITSFTDLLTRKYGSATGRPLDARAEQYLGFIGDGSERMKKLIDDLLTFSKLGSGSRALVPLLIREPLAEALQRLEVHVRQSSAHVSCDLQSPMVLGDASQLARLFQNLIGNAIKFHREDVPPEVRIEAETEGAFWHFKVSDHGIGIAPEYLEKIFEMFRRLNHRQVYKGTGLGLAICKKIVEQHGGTIWAEQISTGGTAFHFTLRQAPSA